MMGERRKPGEGQRGGRGWRLQPAGARYRWPAVAAATAMRTSSMARTMA